MTIANVHMCALHSWWLCNNAVVVLIQLQTMRFWLVLLQTLLLLIVFNKRTTTIVTQQWTLTTVLQSDQMTNHHSNVFVKCWSTARVTCVPHPQMLVSRLQQLELWDHNYHYLSIKLTHEHGVLTCVQYKPACL